LVIPIKGKGACLVGDEVLQLAIHDLVYVPSWEWHQYRAADDEALGFLCLVKIERDRPTLPTADEIAEMKRNPEVAAFIRHL
jgi:gentisate 1,2-dioxygenase